MRPEVTNTGFPCALIFMSSFWRVGVILILKRKKENKGENHCEVGPGHILSLESEIVMGSHQTIFTGMTNALLSLFQPHQLTLAEHPRVCKELIQAQGQVRISLLFLSSVILSMLYYNSSYRPFFAVFEIWYPDEWLLEIAQISKKTIFLKDVFFRFTARLLLYFSNLLILRS